MPRIEVSIPVPDGQRATLDDIEALCRLARAKGLSGTAEIAPFLQPSVMGMSRITGYAIRAEVEEPTEPPRPHTLAECPWPTVDCRGPHLDGVGKTWAVPGGPNVTTSQVADAVRQGLTEPGIDRILLDRQAAYLLVGSV